MPHAFAWPAAAFAAGIACGIALTVPPLLAGLASILALGAALRAYGIAPPERRTGPVLVPLGPPRLTCPQCGSADTEELSRFGSTSCKSMWRCRACREPFDHFRAH